MKNIIFLLALFGLCLPLWVSAVEIIDGDLIRAEGTLDVYIVKILGEKKFKRLVLNPEIFNQYEHLKWENIKDVSSSEVGQYMVSNLVRSVNGQKVFSLYPNGDAGEKRWIRTGNHFLDLGYDWDAVYPINDFERDFYNTGEDLAASVVSEEPIVEEPVVPEVPVRDPITINVPADYTTIQLALDNAINGDTISVKNGTYNESIVINKSVSLIGEVAGLTIVDGQGLENAITVNSGENTLIQRFTIKSQDKNGIYCDSSSFSSVSLKNNYIIDSGWGVVVEGNCQMAVLNNLIYNNKNSTNTDGAGILVKNNFSYQISSEIRNNTINDNYHGIWSEDSDLAVINNIISGNVGGSGSVDSSGIYHSGEGESVNTYNDIWGNGWNYKGDATAGNGTIVLDPQFLNAYNRDYRLKIGSSGQISPCVDKGHPDMAYRDGNRYETVGGYNTFRNDMGAYGGPDNVSW